MAKKNRKKTAAATPTNRALINQLDLNPSLKFKVEEAYKSVRANIMFSVMKKGCKKIVVTSSNAGEGKTTTTINLAITLSQAGQKVLLIDNDLRKPKIHQYFSLSNNPGLTDYLGSMVSGIRNDKIDLFSIVHPTEYDNLSIICSGTIPPNPAELLGSEPMIDFLEEVSQDFDYIILDTPPINIVSDALPIIRESDGVILIVKYNASTHPEVERAINSLEFIDAKILGFVVNFVDTRANGRYKYGSYGKYGRYSRYSYGGGYGGYGGYGYGGYGYGYGGYGYGYGYGGNQYYGYGQPNTMAAQQNAADSKD